MHTLMDISDVSIDRLDDDLWTFPLPPLPETQEGWKEIRIQTPSLIDSPSSRYRLAHLVAKALDKIKNDIQTRLENGFTLKISNNGADLEGRWWIRIRPEEWGLWARFWQSLPYTHKMKDWSVRTIEIIKEDSNSFLSQVTALFSRNLVSINEPLPLPKLETTYRTDLSLEAQLQQPSFSDPFTQLASQAFQTVERHFVSEYPMRGNHRFLYEGDTLKLKEFFSSTFSPKEKEENKKAVLAFFHFALQEYGKEHVDYLQYAFGFNFEEMMEKGEPLLPDHVFKLNIGVNNIEISHVQQLYEKFSNLHRELEINEKNKDEGIGWNREQLGKTPHHFSIRELRGLHNLLKNEKASWPTLGELSSFLNRFLGTSTPAEVKKLSPEKFNQLAGILMPSEEDRERCFTGRKIRHLAILGYKTMGDYSVPDPARNIFESLHIYSDLEKAEDWLNFYELITHVVCKKELFSAHPPSPRYPEKPEWHVGRLIPAPASVSGEKRWFYVDAMTDDNEGDLNYVLLPACDHYVREDRALPFIKLYRSTASNREALDSVDSIAADFNPYGSPGSLHPEKGDGYEFPYFHERTIPLWVGYILHIGNLLQNPVEDEKKILGLLKTAIEEYKKGFRYLSKERARFISTLQANTDPTEVYSLLYQEADRMRELPSYKTAQDIIFCGHSLGGALAQFGMNYFGSHRNRIPCPRYNFVCFEIDGPAANTKDDREFMQFGRCHSEVIRGLGQNWRITHRFEYGDIIPLAGESHQGTTGYDKEMDEEWLTMDVHVFKPLEEAKALEILTAPTHGRRIGQAEESRDYTMMPLSPADLWTLDHAWKLNPRLRFAYGFPVVLSPKLVEVSRRFFSFGSRPILYLMDIVYNYSTPEKVPRDKWGVFFCRQPPLVRR